MSPIRKTFRALLPSVLLAVLAARGTGAEVVRAYLSVPDRVALGGELKAEALLVNAGEEGAGSLPLSPAGKGQVWLEPGAALPLEWRAQVPSELVLHEAALTFSLVAGDRVIERGIAVVPPSRPVLFSGAAAAKEEPVELTLPTMKGPVIVELEATAGARGELAAALEGFRRVRGFATDALVARALVPPVLDDTQSPKELEVLGALQRASGGWGATPSDPADLRTTSWVVLWLGRVRQAGGAVDADVLSAGADYLERHVGASRPEMQSRVLVALAAAGRPLEGEIAEALAKRAQELSPAGRSLAAVGGAAVPLPPKDRWGELNATEASALILALASRKRTAEATSLLPVLVERRGGQPRFDTHEAALTALALKALARGEGEVTGRVRVRLNGDTVDKVKLRPGRPLCRATEAAEAGTDGENVLSVSGDGPGLFCRVVIRPAP